MANYNKVIIIGNLTRDPQLSYTPNQTAIVEFGIATNRKWKTQSGESREEVCFVDCKAFGRNAENINKYLAKGGQVCIEGRLGFDTWATQDGSKRSKHFISIQGFQLLGAVPEVQSQVSPSSRSEGDDIPF